MAMAPIAEGERWAYRKGSLPFEDVTIVKVVSQSGHRKVSVQFEDGPNAGETQWVGRPYLKVKWDERQAFVDREQRWANAKSGYWDVPLGLTCAAALVITETMDDALARDRDHGILQTNDAPLLRQLLQLTESQLFVEGSFDEQGVTYLPWPAMKAVAMAKCRLKPEAVLDAVERDVESWGDSAEEFGYYKPMSSRQVIELEEPWPEYETQKTAWDIVRGWCGESALARWSTLSRVRADNARLSEILGRALDALERAGDEHSANRLRKEAGRAFGKTPDWIKNLQKEQLQ
ncbi:hypothetical protein ART_0151 [Arthrobacter sp. PAMC 25486]|uniref:hypothetical protein n=1 Tax=Arthrobacter sp. PAMC 25486 TaxID=1494608 RepID=UPI000535F813|nr:hypothetical protein [Arthrobacter sp. PAMC 25486]AIX99749.1 hypothetical protein ART_0151 [Arthrobacter sp. PAMC 25486]